MDKKEKCPNCGADMRPKTIQEGWSGVICSKNCGWWFCY